MKVHVSAVSSALGEYCEIEAWIRAKFHIKIPPTDAMLRGSVSHYILEVIEGGIKLPNLSSLEIIRRDLNEFLLDSYTNFKYENPEEDYASIDAVMLDYIDCLAYKFTSRYYKLGVYKKEYVSKWETEKYLKTDLDIEGRVITLSGKIDRYKIIGNDAIIGDYKFAVNPVINESMKIQLDAYALLMRLELRVDNVCSEIEFPLYQTVEHYFPDSDRFLNGYLPTYVDLMNSKTVPPYFCVRKSCNWCQNEVRKKCLELRSK